MMTLNLRWISCIDIRAFRFQFDIFKQGFLFIIGINKTALTLQHLISHRAFQEKRIPTLFFLVIGIISLALKNSDVLVAE